MPGLAQPATPDEPASEVEALPWLLLSAALDDPQSGVLIFDSELRLLHVTSQVNRLLELGENEPAPPVAGLNVLALLSRSALDSASIEEAKRIIGESSSEAQTVILRNAKTNGSIRMRLREVAQGYRIATFEPAALGGSAPQVETEFALKDSLTGLCTRHYFDATLTRILKRDTPARAALLLIDLDRFKAVNDTLGHAAGDSLLKLAAERLTLAAGKNDVVARLGGDEFAVLIHPAWDVEQAISIAKRILDLVQRTYLIDGQLVNIGTSIGIALAPRDGNDSASLMKSADLALYHSKSSGRATFHFFEATMERRAQARRTSELELRRALALRQLELFYQPQVDSGNNRLLGFEALLRWRHPERGMVPPSEFLAVAEEIGVILSIGDWVLRTACREAMNWPEHLTVAVNASPQQFGAGDYADSVKRALAATGLRGDRLEIEIAEGILLRDDQTVFDTLHALRAMNVRIAMDDFGTGYASLSQLARFPFDRIKLDRSLVGYEGENPKQRAIVRAITALGRSLGISTLAEGIENTEQLLRLQGDGCDSAQGFLYSKPVPSSELQEILDRFR